MNFDTENYIEVTKDVTLYPGDIYWMKFRIVPGWLYVISAGISAIESGLEKTLPKHPEYELLARNYEDVDNGFVYYKFRMVDPNASSIQEGSIFEDTQQAGVVGTLLALSALISSCAVLIYFGTKFVAGYKDVAQYNAIESGNITAEEVIELETAKAEIAGSNTIGSQVQKAGIGLALPILAIAAIIYLKR